MPLTSPRSRAGRDPFALVLAFLGVLATFGRDEVRAQAPSAAGGEQKAEATRQIPDTLNFANGSFRARRYELAAKAYERFLKDAKPGPDADDAWFGLANARLFQGRYDQARQAFESFLKVAPDHPNAATALYRIGETSYMLGDLPAARQAFESFTEKANGHKNLETAWPYLGEVCFRMRDLVRAHQAYDQALALFPDGRLADRSRFGLGKTLAAQGELDEARKVLTDLANRGGEWADRAWLQLGKVEVGAGRFAEAQAAFDNLERVAPKSPLLSETRLSRAEALIHLNRRDEAEALLRGLVAEAPHNIAAQAAYALGTSQLESGHPAEAFETLNDARGRFSKTATAPALTFYAGEAAWKLKRANDARALFLKVAEAGPKEPLADDAMVRAARAALETADHKTAGALAGAFATRFPDSPLRADARLIEAQVAVATGRPKDAIAILEASIAEDKPTPVTAQAQRYCLGLAYRRDGQAAKGDEILGTLVKTPNDPAAANAQYVVGQGHFDAKRYAEAIPAFEAYLASKPDGEVAADALMSIAWSRIMLGQLDEASKTLEELISRFPTSKWIAPTRLHLAWALLEKEKPVEAAAAFQAIVASGDAKLVPEAAWGHARALDAAKQTEEALKAYALVAEKYPDGERSGLATLAQARLLTDAKRPAEAAAIYERYLHDHPDPKTAPKGAEVDALLSEWGWSLVDAGKTEDADRIFSRLLQEFPESPHAADARVNLADTAYRAKNYAEVIKLLSPLVAEGATLAERLGPSALLLFAQAQDKNKDWAEAAKSLDRLNTQYPENPYRRESKFLRAEVALKAGDAEAAEAGFAALATEPAAEADPDRFGAAIRRGRIQALLALKRWQDVLTAADEFKAQSPKDPLIADVDYARGRALQGLARFDEARDAYQAVIDARKGGDLAARAQLMRGETYFHIKNYEEALREFFTVDTLYDAPTWQAAALLEAGKVYELLDRWADAAETYEGLRSKFPDDPSSEEAKSRLEAARAHAQKPSGTETR